MLCDYFVNYLGNEKCPNTLKNKERQSMSKECRDTNMEMIVYIGHKSSVHNNTSTMYHYSYYL